MEQKGKRLAQEKKETRVREARAEYMTRDYAAVEDVAAAKPRERRRTDVQLLGRYIVTDPKICHGKPTFRGTRVLVADVLEQVSEGLAWEAISAEWNGSVSQEAIAEAVQLARKALMEHAHEYFLETTAP